jgi:hypothetical protein
VRARPAGLGSALFERDNPLSRQPRRTARDEALDQSSVGKPREIGVCDFHLPENCHLSERGGR